MIQMKETDKTSEKYINRVEISNLPGKDFKGMGIKLFTKLRRKINKHHEIFNKDKEKQETYTHKLQS